MFARSANEDRLMNQFVIVTAPRSGSNMLVGMLNRHPHIKCLGELMRPTPEYMLRTGYRDVLTVLEKVDPKFKDDDYRLSNAESFVREVFSLFPGNPNHLSLNSLTPDNNLCSSTSHCSQEGMCTLDTFSRDLPSLKALSLQFF